MPSRSDESFILSPRRLFSGALFLMLSGFAVKLLGLVYKIPLTNAMGDEGMGYFNTAYTVYTLFFVLSSSGLPVALSLLVSETRAVGREDEVEAVFSAALRLFAAVGLVGTGILALFARPFALLCGNEGAAAGILAVSPTLLFVSMAGAYRGFFQGKGELIPTAISQLVEAAGRFLFGLVLTHWAITRFSLSLTAAFSVAGLTLATFLALLALVAFYRREKRKQKGREALPGASGRSDSGAPADRMKSGFLIRRLLRSALPVTVGSSVLTLAASLDLVLVLRLLQKGGMSAAEANRLWGNYSAMAVPLFNLPGILITPLAYAMTPFVRTALAASEEKRAAEASRRSLFLTILIALPCALGLSVFARPVLSLLFRDGEGIARAVPTLTLLAFSVLPLALLTVSNALLQAYGHEGFPVLSVLLGIAVKVTAAVLLTPALGMIATPISTFLSYTVMAVCNLTRLSSLLGGLSLFPRAICPLAAGVLSVGGATALWVALCHGGLSSRAACLPGIALAAILYVLLNFWWKSVSYEDAAALGLPETLLTFLEKHRLLWKRKELL